MAAASKNPKAAPAAFDADLELLAQCEAALRDHERRFRAAMARNAWQDDRALIAETLATIHALRTEILHMKGSSR